MQDREKGAANNKGNIKQGTKQYKWLYHAFI